LKTDRRELWWTLLLNRGRRLRLGSDRSGLSLDLSGLDIPELFQKNVGHFHSHPAEVGNQVGTGRVTCQGAIWR
jgi:hypothetical protein